MGRWVKSASFVVASVLTVTGGWSAPASAAYSSQPGPSWVPNDNVKTVARSGGVVYIGGAFTTLTDPATGARVTRNRVAALDAATGKPLAWDPGANGVVEAIDVAPDGTVYLGGSFTSVGGSAATRLAAVTPGGTPVPGWKASANSTVFDVEVGASSLWVGGAFGSVNGRARPRLARLDRQTGTLATGFDAAVTGGRVLSVELSENGTSVLLGGAFTGVGGQPRGFVAAVAPDTGAVGSWNPGPSCDTCSLWDLAVGPGRVYAAMSGPGGRLVAWDSVTGNRLWSRGADGDVQAVDVEAGVVYAGGHFGPTFGGNTRYQLVALDAARGAVLPYRVEFTGRLYPGIWDLDADADGLRIAGGFTVAGSPARRYAVLPVL